MQSDDTLYTTKDVLTAFPFMSSQTLNYRLKKKELIRLRHPSRGAGRPNLFLFPELVECGVVDICSSVGVLNDLKRVHATLRDRYGVKYLGPGRSIADPAAPPTIHDWDITGPDPDKPGIFHINTLESQPHYYERYDYKVSIVIRINWDVEPPGREFHMHYIPDELRTEDDERPAEGYGEEAATAQIRVRRVYEMARWRLSNWPEAVKRMAEEAIRD